MTWQDIKWKYVAIGAVFSLMLFMSVSLLWQRDWVEKPIISTLVADPAIISAELFSPKTQMIFILELDEVDDLANTVRRVRSLALDTQPNAQLEFKDKPTPNLSEVYHELHFSIFQALQRGDYESLAERVELLKQRENISYARVEIDQNDLYVQLHAHDGYLYKVIPRGGVVK